MIKFNRCVFSLPILQLMRNFVFIIGDNDVPRCQMIVIPVAMYRFSSTFLDRLVSWLFFIDDVPSSVEISYFMVILSYCYLLFPQEID